MGWIYGLICGLSALLAEPATDTLSLTATDGYVVALADDASASERFAARELADYLKKVTGKDFPIVAPEAARNKPQLAVGPGAARVVMPSLKLDDLGADGILMQRSGQNILLTGGDGMPRGTLYSVYSFLEDVVGVRWWTPEWTEIPRRRELAIGTLDVRYVSPFEYREPFFSGVLHKPQWAAANKANGHHFDLQKDAARGGAVGYTPGLPFVHTFYMLVPAKQYFAKHPEWFSQIGGQRVGPPARTQLCLTNPELLQHVIAQAKEHLRRSPPETMISISQNDYHDARCQCDQCLAVEREEGGPAGSLIRFVNAVADAVKDEFPSAAVDTLAYQYTRKAPLKTKPRPNVIVRLCSIECDFGRPLSNGQNRAFAEDLDAWSKICNRVYIWTYESNFAHYLIPYPSMRASAENMRIFARAGVKGVFDQGSYQGPAELVELRAYLSSKLLWNPWRDERELTREFVQAYYGAGSAAVLTYISTMHKAVENSGGALFCNTARADVNYLTLSDLLAADRAFDSVPVLAMQHPVYGPRIRFVRACVYYAILNRLPSLRVEMGKAGIASWPFSQTPQAMLEQFRDICTEVKCVQLAESKNRTLDSFVVRDMNVAPVIAPPLTAPEMCADMPPKNWRQVTQDQFMVARSGWVEVDLNAAGGLTVTTGGGHRDWTFQWDLSPLVQESGGQAWDVYASVRVIRKGQGAGVALTSGFYDTAKLTELAPRAQIKVTDTLPTYRYYRIGRVNPTSTGIWWLAPAGNKDSVESISVDRLVMVRVGG